jgi:integrase
MRSPRGSIRQRGRSSWELSVRLNGRRVTRTIHAADRTAAENALLDLRRELRDEGVPDRDPTMAELVDEWLSVVRGRVKERTAKRYRELLTLHVLPVIGSERVRSLRPGDVQRVVDKVLATRSARTALHVYRVTSECLGEAERWGIATNVAKAVRPPRPARPELTIPTAEETHMILRVVKGSIAEGPAILAVGCGVRLGEALALRWQDCDIEGSRVRVTGTMHRGGRTEPKTPRSRRTVAVPGFALAWLKEHRTAQAARRLASAAWLEDGYVFDRGGGVPMSVESVGRRFAQLVETVGLEQVRFHDLRHAFATRLLEANISPKIVSEALGHASVSITLDIYSHVLPSMSRTAADAIEAVFGELHG